MASITHAAEKKAFEVALNRVMKKSKNAREEGFVGVVNAMEKLLGNTWPPEAFDRLRTAFGRMVNGQISSVGCWTRVILSS